MAIVTNKKTGTSFAPFNIIAMKDIKDKKTQKPGLRPLFDCVDSIQSAVEDVRNYLESGPDKEDVEVIESFLKKLTDMQIQILEISKKKLQGQNLSPVDSARDDVPMLKQNVEPEVQPVKGPQEIA